MLSYWFDCLPLFFPEIVHAFGRNPNAQGLSLDCLDIIVDPSGIFHGIQHSSCGCVVLMAMICALTNCTALENVRHGHGELARKKLTAVADDMVCLPVIIVQIAMTGAVSLRGCVDLVDSVYGKAVTAASQGVDTFYVPAGNMEDLKKCRSFRRPKGLKKMKGVKTMEEMISLTLTGK